MEKITLNKENILPLAKKASLYLLTGMLVIIILIFFTVRSRVDTYTRQFNQDLQSMINDGVSVNVIIDRDIPIDISIPVSDLIDMEQIFADEIPINTTVPIRTSVRINQTVRVPVEMPFGGSVMVSIPLDMNIPIEEDIPISTTVAINPRSFMPGDNIIHINQVIPVDMPLDLNISLDSMGLESQFDSITNLLNTVRLLFLLRSI